MKLSETWLREWVDPPLTREELCEKLTLAGLEIESLTPVAEKFSHVVVAEIISVKRHPDADRLHICEVNIGRPTLLNIVCGATNVKVGMKVPAALVGAVLPNNKIISATKIRNVPSDGMLCSALDLGLATESEGLLQFPPDAKLGLDVYEYLKLSDYVIEVAITPNRGDCLSVQGMAKEIAALTQSKLIFPTSRKINSTAKDTLPVVIDARTECPRYVGRVVRGIKADAVTPIWMQERLRRSGIRCISPVVDVMNYVMLELGQPMHAFDLKHVIGKIHVRMANVSEQLKLLDGQTVKLNQTTLIIADDQKPLAIAGVMGGMDSGVNLLTTDVFLESAFFAPEGIARTGRHFRLNSESSYRFERGVDPTLQKFAIERATELLLEIVGGKPGPIIDILHEKYLPQPTTILLRAARISKILGLPIPTRDVEAILKRLEFSYKKTGDNWKVVPPVRRFDINLEVDVIEEIARLYGYDKIPLRHSVAELVTHPRSESQLSIKQLRYTLCDLGYQEVITYSFIDKKLQMLFDPEQQPKELVNPITADMTVMRTNLWPGLVSTLLYNQNRQQLRTKIFEVGLRFVTKGTAVSQQRVLAGLAWGTAFPEQWGIQSRPVDFFDLKGDVENLLQLTLASSTFTFKPGTHPALHPGQRAQIMRAGQEVGIIGALHPSLIQTLDIQGKVFVFELFLDKLELANMPNFSAVSKFPEIRRDIAIWVDQAVPARAIQDTISETAGELLKEVNIFDVYQGKDVATERKSIALSLTLQHSSRTLVDEEVAKLMERVIGVLREKFAAELRG